MKYPVLVAWDLIPVGEVFVFEEAFGDHEGEAAQMWRLQDHQWVKDGPVSYILHRFVNAAGSLEKAKKLLGLLPDGEAKLSIWAKPAAVPKCAFVGRAVLDRIAGEDTAD